MATKQYNPYNNIKNIVGYKADWHTAKQLGQDPTQYYQAAVPDYQELVKNGYESIAQQLTDMDYIKAKDLLKNYKPDDEIAIDNYVNEMSGTADAREVSAEQTRAYGADPSTQKLLDMAIGAGDAYQNFANQARDIGTGAVSTQPSDTVNNMLNQWQGGNERLNGQIRYDENGNVISGLNTAHYNTGRQQLDYINNFDVTKQPYYQGIMDQYKLGGYNAAQGAYANGAADNGGNIDSYAAANANRQQLAFTTAGQQAALQAAQQNANNWQNLYSQMSQDLNNQGVLNANTLQQAAQMYSVDAQERMNALDVAGAMERQVMANAINGYLGNIQADMQKYGIDAETAMNRENNRAALEQITAQLAAQERMNTENNETTRLGYASQERMNTENNQTQRYGYDTNLAGIRDTNQTNLGIAGINKDAQLGVAGINRDATLGAAGINANASMSNAALQADLNRYLGELGYNQALALGQLSYDQALALGQLGYNQALDAIYAQGDINSQLSAQEAQQQRNMYEWLASMGMTTDAKGNIVSASGGTGAETSVDSQLADAYQMTSRLVELYKTHGDASLTTPADVYAAAMEYDNEKYGGAHQKEIYTYINNFMNLGKKADSVTGGGVTIPSIQIPGLNP